MKSKKSTVMSWVLCSLIFIISVISIMFFREEALFITAEIALKSAESFLPEDIPVFSISHYTEVTEEETTKATTEKPSEKEETTEKPTEEATQKASATAKEDFTQTDEDISALVSKTEKTASKDKEDGKISEYTYKNDGVTDKLGLVRVKNVNKTDIDIKKLLSEKPDLEVRKDEPAVLVFHTHTTETYQILERDFYPVGNLTRSNDKGVNMVRVGEEITEQIEKAGYKVIHDKVIHDSSYNGAYAHSRKTVQQYLKEYSSIKIVLDIHRDAIQRSDGTKIKPVATVSGKKAAQIMIISGCQEEGNGIENFPQWKKNLVFALHLQKTLEENFEGITRPLYFSPRKYNMDLTTCSLLVEIGSDANTLDEAVYTGRCLGKALSVMLKEYEVYL